MLVLAVVLRLLVVTFPPSEPSSTPPSLMARLTDGSVIGVAIIDEALPLTTPHGKLLIPSRDVRRLHLAARLTDEERRAIDQVIAELGSLEVARRDEAAAKLLAWGRRAYPFVVRAMDHPDRELALSARKLRERFLQQPSDSTLVPHELDVVWTDDGKFAGRLEIVALRVRTTVFGERTLRTSDLVELRPPSKSNTTVPLPAPNSTRERGPEETRRGQQIR
ncbi:MAG: hypothetical protein N2039_02835 [Gemmataceae bacterium]|nr:hypothetical protein [Gemmataceae bacterium]